MPHVAWARQAPLWVACALAALLRLFLLRPTTGAIVIAFASVFGVAAAYVWMWRAFGPSISSSGVLLLASSNIAVAAGRADSPLGLVPVLIALWLLTLSRGLTAVNLRPIQLAIIPLALASLFLPASAVLFLVMLAATVLTPTGAVSRSDRHPFRLTQALVVVGPLAGAALGLTHGPEQLAHVPDMSLWLLLAFVAIMLAGWLALSALLGAPARTLWRWYALASDPRERRRATWSALRDDPLWRMRALLWLAVTLPLPLLLVAPWPVALLPLLPAIFALPGMVAEELRRWKHGAWIARLMPILLGILALALAISTLLGVG
jgi:hypothetical protein